MKPKTVQEFMDRMGSKSKAIEKVVTTFIERENLNQDQIESLLEGIECDYEDGGLQTLSRHDLIEICDSMGIFEMVEDEDED